jgi:hypothetical protein
MKLLKQAFAVFGVVMMLAVMTAFIAPKRTNALVAALVQIVPGTTTHVGQNESQLVSLACLQGTQYCVTIDSGGNYSTTAYVVPSGYTLIITDWEWQVSGAEPGVRWADRLYTVNSAGIPVGTLVYTYATPDQNGAVYAHEHYATGIRAGSGTTIADGRADDNTGDAQIQGYLVPND